MVKHDMLENTALPLVLNQPSRGTRRARQYAQPTPAPLSAATEAVGEAAEQLQAYARANTGPSAAQHDWWEHAGAASLLAQPGSTVVETNAVPAGVLQLPVLPVHVQPDPLLIAMHVKSMSAWYRTRETARLTGRAPAPSALDVRNARGVRWDQTQATSGHLVAAALTAADLDPTATTQMLVDREAAHESLRGLDTLAGQDAATIIAEAALASPFSDAATPTPTASTRARGAAAAAAGAGAMCSQQRDLVAEVLRAGSNTQKLSLAHMYALRDAIKRGSAALRDLDPATVAWLRGAQQVQVAPVPVWARLGGTSDGDEESMSVTQLVREVERCNAATRDIDEASVHTDLALGRPGALRRLRGFAPDSQYNEGAAAVAVNMAALEAQLCVGDAGLKPDLMQHLQSQMIHKLQE